MQNKVKKVDGFIYTQAIKKLRRLHKRIRIVPGGTSAGKTFGIIPILIDLAIKTKNLEISIVSESIPHLRRGAAKDFLKIMKATGRYNENNWNRTLLTYYFANGSYIEFFSADQEDKLRGARRHILYINECNNITFNAYQQLAIRTSELIWLDFNPSNEFWVHTELQGDEDAEMLILTYKDNEALPESIVKEIEKALDKGFYNVTLANDKLFQAENIKNSYWANWWRVYGLGLIGTLEGVIFQNWKQIDNIPPTAQLLGYGLDFGYTNDPTALVGLYKYNNTIIFDEVIYQTGLNNNQIAKLMRENGVKPYDIIIADGSEPKSIEEIKLQGFKNITKAEKGAGSINFGIDLMQQYDFLVTSRSTYLIKELRNYMWAKDKTGKTLNEPIGLYNHAIDAMRYIAIKTLAKKPSGNKIKRTRTK